MKKLLFCGVFAFILVMAFVNASGFSVEVVEKEPIIIADTGRPAVYDFIITNHGRIKDNFEIFSLEGLTFSPRGFFEVMPGKNTIEVVVYPSEQIRDEKRGLNLFGYKLRGQDSGIFEDTLRMRIIDLEDAIVVSAKNIWPEDDNVDISIKNIQNINLENFSVKLSSVFFDEHEETISLKPYEEKEIIIDIGEEKLSKLVAGPYLINCNLEFDGAKGRVEGNVDYLEKEGTSIMKKTSGFIIRENLIKKTNEGNINVDVKIQMKKNIISRLFTGFSIQPDYSERHGLNVYYTWERDLAPSETFEVIAKTNYTFPFILIITVIITVFLVRATLKTNLVLRKRVSFVRTKGGEFALKIRLNARARKNVKNVKIVDIIPPAVKIYGKFVKKPDKIDESSRKIVWVVDELHAGEERVFSYIIYSKLKILGRFELPIARAVYSIDSTREFVSSNKTAFVSETTDEEEN